MGNDIYLRIKILSKYQKEILQPKQSFMNNYLLKKKFILIKRKLAYSVNKL